MTLFSKIIARQIPAKIAYEDEHCIVIHDIAPQAPVHLLLIPKKPIVSANHVTDADAALIGHLMTVIPKVADAEGLGQDGYRVVTNIGDYGGQTVPHLHYHILGGRQLSWPPG